MKSSRGFSAIELVIVIALSVILLFAVTEIYVTYSNSYLYQNASINTSSSGAAFMNEFNELGLQAHAIVASRAFSGTTYTTGSTTVIFELPSRNASGDVIANTYDYAVLYSSTTRAYRILDADASSVRVDNTKMYTDVLSNLTFSYNNATPASATNVTADIVTRTQVKLQTFTSRLKQQVYLRNI